MNILIMVLLNKKNHANTLTSATSSFFSQDMSYELRFFIVFLLSLQTQFLFIIQSKNFETILFFHPRFLTKLFNFFTTHIKTSYINEKILYCFWSLFK